MSYLVDFQPLALKAMRLEALLPTKALTAAKEKVNIDRDTVRFYRAMHFSAYARSWDRMSSVRLSVCLSVCNVGGL